MRRTLAILIVAALFSCRRATADRTENASADTAGAQPIDEAAVKAMSHALLDAYDRADEEDVARTLGPTFVLFDELHLAQRDAVLKKLRKRRARQAPPRTRTYGEEHVSLGGNSGVFIGETVEHFPLDGARPCEDGSCVTGDFDGWNTLVWVPGGGAWKLIEMVKGRKPGAALDVGMGQGRNALYLASQGWRVTGFDISDEAIRQAREAAAARKLTIEAINADANTWDYGVEKWDLVVLIYAGCDERIVKRSLKTGGLVVSEHFHKDSVPAVGVGTGEFSAQYRDGFHVLRDEVVEDVGDWSWKDRLRQKLVRSAAEKL